ncbi:MAG TPA: isoleucine--tRNA ligase [Thermoplasmata archaeon]|nr:isoleucine--tRNA ligase [Thermoplasmata archaeon]
MAEEESPGSLDLARLEAEVRAFWERHRWPERVMAGAPDGPLFRFTEGPPTANGAPHIGHLVARTLKDIELRYRRMRGDRIVSPMAGWDCHGLPVELEVEKKFGLKSHKEIEAFGVAKFSAACRTGALEVAEEWRQMSGELGYWLDYAQPYYTMDAPFIESVWWSLKTLFDRGLLGPGHYSLPYCPRCETPLSSHEVAQGYAETTDPSVTVRFPLVPGPDGRRQSALVWTTTPWTLPANLLLAANDRLTYVGVPEDDGGELLLSEPALARYFPTPPKGLRRYPAQELAGRSYRPPFDFAGPGTHRYRIVLDASVEANEGTGFVHIAPGYGPEDFRIGEREKVGVFDPLDSRARFTDAVPPVAGKHFKAADPILLELLRASGRLYRSESLRHTYPFCWRCQSALLYRALDAWFVRTSRATDRLTAHNATVDWHPPHLRDGRFGNFLTEAKDWALSRTRYWGTPLPIWKCGQGHSVCVGSFAELATLQGSPLPADFDPHRTGVDPIRFPCPECGEEMRREPYTIDGWYDSGAAPFAQFHYPFEPGPFDPKAPLDFIAEGLDQTRGWFYSLLVLSTLLFDRPAYRTCVSNGLVLDERGLKMSKSRGNVLEPRELLRRMGADAIRWTLLLHDYTEPIRLGEARVRTEGQRGVLTLLNVLAFYRDNALADRLPPPAAPPTGGTLLDQWLLSRLAGTAATCVEALDRFDDRKAALALQELVSDLSTWYLRRSRPRFWSEEDPADRRAAHETLAFALLGISRLIAPLLPFTAEQVYQEVTGAQFKSPDRSVHAERYPVELEGNDPGLDESMAALRQWAEVGRELRERAGVKSRFPLAVWALELAPDDPVRRLGEEGIELLAEELNVREVRYELPGGLGPASEAEWVDRTLENGRRTQLSRSPTPELRREGLLREAMRRLQSARKTARLQYTDRIRLTLWADAELLAVLRQNRERLIAELLAESLALLEGPAPEGPEGLRWTIEGLALAADLARV